MIKLRSARVSIALVVTLIIVFGATCKVGRGTICSFHLGGISTVCPLGFLQMALASKSLSPQLWLPLGLTLLGVIILGRFFCAWVCPAALLREVFRRNGAAKPGGQKRTGTVSAPTQPAASPASRAGATAVNERTPWTAYTRYALLGGSLVASFLFGFPVFCLVCPVGLFFGTVFAVSRLLFRQQPSLELLLCPAILGIELLLLKNWCRSLCPLGALLGLIGSLGRVGRPVVDRSKCLTARGIGCRVCRRACPHGIDLIEQGQGAAQRDCTRCLECYEKCPAGAIAAWPLRAPGSTRRLARRGDRPRPSG